MSDDPGERYAEQAAAWDAEKVRRAALPWWRKAIESYWDWRDEHALFVTATLAATGITITVAGIALFAAWLTHALR
ncbi:MAG TPA: hypothetical protein VMI75_22730 [Polyangiaceae bacterium]|nr:hypothetical protein [Polyangiaceae bacterium]